MPYNIIHAGTAIQRVNNAGTVSTLALPTGVTVSATVPTLFATLAGSVVAVRGPSKNLRIDTTTLAVTPMSLLAPTGTPTVAAGASGLLTGDYSYKVSFAQMDGTTVISESPLFGPSASVTVSSKKIELTALGLSTEASCNARLIYRTASNGAVYFLCAIIADNTTTTYSDNIPDASLATTSAPDDLGNPAGTTTDDSLTAIVAWGDRLWAVRSDEPDLAYFSGVNRWFAWPATQSLAANPIGQASTGIVAFIPRRSELGLAKRNGLWKVTGDGPTNYQCVPFWQGAGVRASASVVVIRDVAYWLAEDGVYQWNAEGVSKISERVNPWFTTSTYFNRSGFGSAFARWNPTENTYELHLPSVSSGVLDRWVSYDIERDRWLGPHKSDAFMSTCGGTLEMVSGTITPMVGSDKGTIFIQANTSGADEAQAIDCLIRTAWHSSGVPEVTKVFGQLSMYSGVEPAGVVTITPYVGGEDATAGATLTHDLTTGEETLGRLGLGRLVSLQFEHNTINERMRLYGYQIPVMPVGVR